MFTDFPLATSSCFVRDLNKRPFLKFKDGRLFEGGRLFKGGRLLDNFTFRKGADSRVGAYSRDALIRSIAALIVRRTALTFSATPLSLSLQFFKLLCAGQIVLRLQNFSSLL